MKTKWVGNEELQKLTQVDPPRAYTIARTVVTTASDVKDTYADWQAADSLSGIDLLRAGGARITGSGGTEVEYTTGTDAAVTSLVPFSAATVGAVVVEWSLAGINAVDIRSFTARLDSDFGGAQNVTRWRGRLWRVVEVDTQLGERPELWTLSPLIIPVDVAAAAGTNEVTFDILNPPRDIDKAPTYIGRISDSDLDVGGPATVLTIEAYQGDGRAATNVAWIGNNSASTVTNNNHRASRFNLNEIENQDSSDTFTKVRVPNSAENGLPRFSIGSRTYSQQTIAFTGAGNRLDLGAAPTNTVEFIVEAEEPADTSVTAQARRVGGSTSWTTIVDGQVASGDLAGSTSGEYTARAILNPSANGNMTPGVRRLGVREIVSESVPDSIVVGPCTYSMDPDTLKASIPAMQIAAERDLRDHRDFASELFSDNHAGDIDIELWWGSTSLARQYWMHLDTFRTHNYDSARDPIVVDLVHPIALTKQTIPTGTTGLQSAVVYTGSTDTTETVYGDLLERVAFPGRYRGALLSTTSTLNIAKTIARPRPMKDELDRVAFIEGGVTIPTQGRLKFRRIFTSTGGFAPDGDVVHFEAVEPIRVSPNLDRRIVQFRAPYGWSEELNAGQGGYAGQSFVTSTAAISKLGHALLGDSQDLEDEKAKWLLQDSTSVGSLHAGAIARRTIAARRQGMMLVTFSVETPHPHVEVGDPCTVPTDRFVGRDVESDRPIRGSAEWFGVIAEHDLEGRVFTAWVPDITAFTKAASFETIQYGEPEFLNLFIDTARYPEAIDASTNFTLDQTGFRMYANYRVSDETKSFGAVTSFKSGSTSVQTRTLLVSTTGVKSGRSQVLPATPGPNIVRDSTSDSLVWSDVSVAFTPYLGTTGSGKAGPTVTLKPSTSTQMGHGFSALQEGSTDGVRSGSLVVVGSGLTLDRDSLGRLRIRLST